MKIKRINIGEHFLFAKQSVNLTYKEMDSEGKEVEKPSQVIVFIGQNGTGKTSLLNGIYDLLLQSYSIDYYSTIEIYKKYPNIFLSLAFDNNRGASVWKDIKELLIKDNAKIVFMPSSVNINIKINNANTNYNKNEIFHVINENLNTHIEKFIVEYINALLISPQIIDKILTKENKTTFTIDDIKRIDALKKQYAFDDINNTFDIMDMKVRLVSIDNLGNAIFTNDTGNQFKLGDLSSGEKQLFIRILSLKMLDINNSIILIDEPEISMHPDWQRKIVDIFKSIGKDNQIIIATHSPLIAGSCYPHEIKILKRKAEGDEQGKVIIEDFEGHSRGVSVEYILEEVMDSKPRYYKSQEKLEKLQKWLEQEKYEENKEEFEDILAELEKEIGIGDINLISIRRSIEIAKINQVKQ